MNNIPTPETDAARHDLSDYGSPVLCSWGDWIPVDVACRLERERDKARKERDQLKEALIIMENLLKPGLDLFPEIGGDFEKRGREMSERITPETDALALSKDGFGPTAWEWRVHSRRLERERNEAREKATNFYAKIGELDQALKASAELLCFFFEQSGITRKDLEERLEAAK